MSNPQKRKGDKAEREAAELLTEVTGFECQRNLSRNSWGCRRYFRSTKLRDTGMQIGKTNQELALLSLEK